VPANDNEQGVDIRLTRPDDLDDVYRICLLTADNGQDATPLVRDPKLPGYVWAAPYLKFEPSLAFVAEDAEGVAAYVLGALDTRAFERRLERDWWPGLRPVVPEREHYLSPLEQVATQDIHHPWLAPDEVVASFPSHLHIDLLPRLQGRGLGRRLMETMASSLRAQGSPGAHLDVSPANHRAAGFYRHLGLGELPATGPRIFTMDLRDAAP
jgi:ribosomal protein S18 acetylase RimI-like enzyme